MALACPSFKIPSHWTVSTDIYLIYISQMGKLRQFFNTHCQKICITIDTLTSIQRINYMCITCHFIDNDWKMHKKLISFVPINSLRGEYIAKCLKNCLLDWGRTYQEMA